jgi:Xaa-Pro aminopeptidase
VFAARRKRLLEAMGPDAVALLIGARMVTRSADTHFPFRQDSDFWYLTGFDHPNAIAVLRGDGGPEYTLFVEPRDPEAETWTGYRPGVEGAQRDYDADQAFPNDEFAKQLPELLAAAKRVYHVLGRDPSLDARIAEICDGMRLRSRLGRVPPEAIVDPRSVVHEMRLRKDPGELDVMRRASAISEEGHREAARRAQPGAFEYELEAALEHAFRRRGARGPAYTTIVGSGANATVLHYVRNDQKLRDGELVLIDAGCELDGYASDVTRTYPVGGSYRGAQRAVYEVVLEAQEAAFAAIRPGRHWNDPHDAAVRAITQGLVRIGLLKGRVPTLIRQEAYRKFYMHRTGHWLGMDVHDVGDYKVGDEWRVLEPGMCMTVEPGIYIPAGTPGVPRRWWNIGVRIEDDVAVTGDGFELLTDGLPRTPDEIERVMNG